MPRTSPCEKLPGWGTTSGRLSPSYLEIGGGGGPCQSDQIRSGRRAHDQGWQGSWNVLSWFAIDSFLAKTKSLSYAMLDNRMLCNCSTVVQRSLP